LEDVHAIKLNFITSKISKLNCSQSICCAHRSWKHYVLQGVWHPAGKGQARISQSSFHVLVSLWSCTAQFCSSYSTKPMSI